MVLGVQPHSKKLVSGPVRAFTGLQYSSKKKRPHFCCQLYFAYSQVWTNSGPTEHSYRRKTELRLDRTL